jgi:hypothetical protein
MEVRSTAVRDMTLVRRQIEVHVVTYSDRLLRVEGLLLHLLLARCGVGTVAVNGMIDFHVTP